MIKVSDTGSGIAEADLKAIFERFGQSGRAQVQREGSGLGLSISRELVRLMNGDITAESQLGEGSIFTITLNLETCTTKHSHPDTACTAAPVAERGQQEVLLVGTNGGLVRQINQRLQTRGYAVKCLKDFDELTAALDHDRHQIVIADLDSWQAGAATLKCAIQSVLSERLHIVGLSHTPHACRVILPAWLTACSRPRVTGSR